MSSQPDRPAEGRPREDRDAASVRIFPPGVPLAVILAGLVLDRLWPIGFGTLVSSWLRYGVGGSLLIGAVFGLGAWAVVVFRRAGESEKPWEPTHGIVRGGPYRFTRNPMYLQMVVGCLGFALLLANGWILMLTPLSAWILHRFVILPEERYLERKFGEEYLAYKRAVRRWL